MKEDAETGYSFDNPLKHKPSSGISVHEADIALRLGFIRKVYGILTAQLVFTMIVCLICQLEVVKNTIQQSPILLIESALVLLSSLALLISKRHDSSDNLYLLAVFTMFESISLGTLITFCDNDVVIKVLVTMTTVFLLLTAYMMLNKDDYSIWETGLCLLLWIFSITVLLQVRSEPFDYIILVSLEVLLCGVIIFNVDAIMHRLSPEEYVPAIVDLYVNLIIQFVCCAGMLIIILLIILLICCVGSFHVMKCSCTCPCSSCSSRSCCLSCSSRSKCSCSSCYSQSCSSWSSGQKCSCSSCSSLSCSSRRKCSRLF